MTVWPPRQIAHKTKSTKAFSSTFPNIKIIRGVQSQHLPHLPKTVCTISLDCERHGSLWLNGVSNWPTGVRVLELMQGLDHSIEDVTWPSALMFLVFPTSFNQPIERVVFPASLQELRFGDCFTQPIENVTWPPRLHTLSVGERFNQPIEYVMWPPRLDNLSLGGIFNQPIGSSGLDLTSTARLSELFGLRH